MTETPRDADPAQLIAEAQAAEANAKRLHAEAGSADPRDPKNVAAEAAEIEANEEWEAASAVTSKLEGFTGGEAAD